MSATPRRIHMTNLPMDVCFGFFKTPRPCTATPMTELINNTVCHVAKSYNKILVRHSYHCP